MHHLIFIPSAHLAGIKSDEQLSAVGLADHAQGAEPAPGIGPTGEGGTLFGWRKPGRNERLHYEAAAQTWLPAAASDGAVKGRYHVGWWNASPPTEADLRRPAVLSGRDVLLGNGENWHVAAPHDLPHDLILQDDGSLAFEPKRRYQAVCVEADRWRRRLAGEPQGVPYLDLWRFGLLCLSLNYRLPPELASSLRLIDTDNVKSVMLAALGGEG